MPELIKGALVADQPDFWTIENGADEVMLPPKQRAELAGRVTDKRDLSSKPLSQPCQRDGEFGWWQIRNEKQVYVACCVGCSFCNRSIDKSQPHTVLESGKRFAQDIGDAECFRHDAKQLPINRRFGVRVEVHLVCALLAQNKTGGNELLQLLLDLAHAGAGAGNNLPQVKRPAGLPEEQCEYVPARLAEERNREIGMRGDHLTPIVPYFGTIVLFISTPLPLRPPDLPMQHRFQFCGLCGGGSKACMRDETSELGVGAGDGAQQAAVDGVLEADGGA